MKFREKKMYILSLVLFGIYVLNNLVGKLSTVVRESNIPIGLDDRLTALILFSSVVVFVIGIYKYETFTYN